MLGFLRVEAGDRAAVKAKVSRRSAALWLCCAWGCASEPSHGRLSSLSTASRADWKPCPHGVPEEVCVRCHPRLSGQFKKRGDWCPEHDVPESQCLKCHPDLDFSPALAPPLGADVKALIEEGGDLPALEPHLVEGKVTIFDFHATWCPPCRQVDEHLYAVVKTRPDLAIRKINVGSWDSPVAERFLGDVPELPHLIVYDRRGRRIAAISGKKLSELDRAIADASR